MYCSKCGARLGTVNRFCGICGAKTNNNVNPQRIIYTPGTAVERNPEAGELSKKVVTLILGLMFPLCFLLTFFPFYIAGGEGYTIYRAYGMSVWYGGVGLYGAIGLFVAMCLLASKSDRRKIVGGFLTIGSLLAMIISVFLYVAGYDKYYRENVSNHVWLFGDSGSFRPVSPGVFRSGSYGVVVYVVIFLLLASVVLSIVQLHQRKWEK